MTRTVSATALAAPCWRATLAYMAAKGEDRVHSATFWAAQTDFSEAGELSVFVDEAQLEALKQKMDSEGGVLPGSKMAGAFNMLRANDLIWSFVINNYMLGKQPCRSICSIGTVTRPGCRRSCICPICASAIRKTLWRRAG